LPPLLLMVLLLASLASLLEEAPLGCSSDISF
jgi:hypothetical protein